MSTATERGGGRVCPGRCEPAGAAASVLSRAAYARRNLPEPRLVPVAEAWTLQARMRCPAPPAHHLVSAEPRRRVAVVRIGPETGVGLEPARGPLPHLAAGGQPGAARRLPFGFAGQARPAPARQRVRLRPGDAAHPMVGGRFGPSQRTFDR